MKALVVQNSPDTPIGLVGPILEQQFGIELTTVDAKLVDLSKIETSDYGLFIILGAPEGVYQRDINWINAQFRFTQRLLSEERPLLGICFGGQMIASALGATVEPMGERHCGWISNDKAVNEPWIGPWFRWHGDSFKLPDGATPLAYSGDVVQGFQQGRAVAVQFHPEADQKIVQTWVDTNKAALMKDGIDLKAFMDETIVQESQVDGRLRDLVKDVLARCLS